MKAEERKMVWVTKYWSTAGIQHREMSISDTNTAYPIENGRVCFFGAVHKADWHETEQAAIERAEQQRLKKIASLRKQIAKLEKLDFTKKGNDE